MSLLFTAFEGVEVAEEVLLLIGFSQTIAVTLTSLSTLRSHIAVHRLLPLSIAVSLTLHALKGAISLPSEIGIFSKE